MVGGQVDDLAWERKGGALCDLEKVHSRKTGALFCACLRLGLYAAQGERPGGVDRALLAALDGYGRGFGLAFQITDDLLDVQSSAEQAGKRVQKDAVRGKLTYPGFLGVEESRRRAEQLIQEACDCLAPLGPSGRWLAALAQSILKRDR
jgi:geranylgeranyl diphosphate synthase type II